MDRDHSSLIIILLGSVLFALGGILSCCWSAGIRRSASAGMWRSPSSAVPWGRDGGRQLALFIGYIRRKRREGQPWLFHFILWPAYIGVLAVLGVAALHASDNACGGPMSAWANSALIGSSSVMLLTPPLCSTLISRGTKSTSSLKKAAGVASSLCRLPRDRPAERRGASPGWCRR